MNTAEKLTKLNDLGYSWGWMAQRLDMVDTTLSRFARGRGNGLSPEQCAAVHKLFVECMEGGYMEMRHRGKKRPLHYFNILAGGWQA